MLAIFFLFLARRACFVFPAGARGQHVAVDVAEKKRSGVAEELREGEIVELAPAQRHLLEVLLHGLDKAVGQRVPQTSSKRSTRKVHFRSEPGRARRHLHHRLNRGEADGGHVA